MFYAVILSAVKDPWISSLPVPHAQGELHQPGASSKSHPVQTKREQPRACSLLTHPRMLYLALAGGTIPFIRRYSTICP
jgi:hypothetical protein